MSIRDQNRRKGLQRSVKYVFRLPNRSLGPLIWCVTHECVRIRSDSFLSFELQGTEVPIKRAVDTSDIRRRKQVNEIFMQLIDACSRPTVVQYLVEQRCCVHDLESFQMHSVHK